MGRKKAAKKVLGGGAASDPGFESPPSNVLAGQKVRRGQARIILAVVASVGLGVLAVVLRSGGPGATSVRRDPSLSVLLITIDTLRADALGVYGNRAVATPWMDRLAHEGVRFETAHAQNVVTLPSHANILSGRYPFDHGIRDNAAFRFPVEQGTLATILTQAGYRTAAFVSAFPLDSRFGLDRGFDVYDDRLGDPEKRAGFLMQERSGRDTVAAAKAWLMAQGAAKTFVWVHLYEPHFPYAPAEPFASRFASDLYHGEVSYADSLLQPLLEPLLMKGKDDHTLIVLTSDHGEGLGEHGEATHGIFAYETTLRVPLIVHAPALLSPRVVADRVRHVDILPSVLDALGLMPPPDLPGRSFLPVANGQVASPQASYFEAMSSALNRGWAPLAGLMSDRYKLIDLPIPELFDLDQDPHETRNLAATEPQKFEELRAALSRVRAADKGLRKQKESTETRERLRSLGYLAASSTPAWKGGPTEADDPKRLIGLDADLEEVVGLYEAGDTGSALVKAQQVVDARPNMALALQYLGFVQREAGDIEAAVASLRRAVQAQPGDESVAALLGAYLTEAGRPGEAAEVLRVFAQGPAPDLEVLMVRGGALAQLGRPGEAVATFEKALGLDPTNAQAKSNLGTVYLMTRDYARARQLMAEALALDPEVSRAHNALGVIAFETGHADEAISHWMRAVEINPREWDTLSNLCRVLIGQGRLEEARPYVDRFLGEAPRASYAAEMKDYRTAVGR
ncbi:MAG: sulfatase-like hydrolase/transferase [Vicinamibacteria bacterium]|nr:sulfatase-like hydrolase/transferase [Vicinamibacteria bacterium]